ncbi:double zinc ribbon domain-containing protein [Luteolibacter algae]|uniref:Double zinc ribbon domain-containing protein n=1 Tax=Luteolibacter algae TaxID=454151 RepID=A0ABW5D503_9BACT
MFLRKKPASKILDWLYPSICSLCECGLSEGKSLCNECASELPRIVTPFCDICSEPFDGQIDGDFDCPNCRRITFHFEFARAAMDRSDGMLGLVHGLKYGRQIHLARDLGALSAEAFSDPRFAIALEEKWLLVPVPLHWIRKRQRHFNQAEEIARELSKKTGLPLADLLYRSRKTPTQTRLTRKQRMENLKDAFAVRKSWRKKNPATSKEVPGVILVDDVFTTGSTVDACAKVLRKAGVPRVAVLTAMRG